MKKLVKRILLVSLIVTMIIPLLATTGISVTATTSSGTCGDNLTWTLDDEGTLTISGSGDMYDFWSGYDGKGTSPWSFISDSIKKVVIEDSVTTIGNSAFYHCDLLENVLISNSVISIGYSAFEGCKSLKTINIPASVISIDGWAFRGCKSLQNICIPEAVTSINDRTFSGCLSLENVIIPDSVTTIGDYAFFECSMLQSVSLPKHLIIIGSRAFAGCSTLKSVIVPDSVNSISSYPFSGCGSLEKIEVSAGNEYFMSDDGVLYDIERTKLINYPGGKTDNNFSIPDSVSILEYGAFQGNSYLQNVVIPDSVIEMRYSAFMSCTSLQSVIIGNSITSMDSFEFGNCTSLESVIIPDSVTYISPDSFYNCTNLIIKCNDNSYAHMYAIENGIAYHLNNIGFSNYISDNNYTCTEDGTKTAVCDCGCGLTDTIVDIGSASHRYELDILREPTCSDKGLGMYMCTECGEYYTETLSTVDHVFNDYIYNNDATCTVDGTKTANCDFGCGTTNTVIAEGSMEHSYTNYVYNEDATCTSDGTMTANCDFGCGISDTVTAPDTKKEHIYVANVIENATCTSTGTMLYICSCKDYYTEVIPIINHIWSDWNMTLIPTSTSVGSQTRTCTVCSTTETEEIPMVGIPEIIADNYHISISEANYIKDIRFAIGEYTTPTKIKNAEGNVALSNAIVVKNTVDGLFEYTMPDGGYYTFWIRMNDGNEYFLYADMTKMNQEVVADGVTITIKNLYGVKDFFIAEGDYDTYAELKANYMFNATSAKIGAKHNYTYTVKNPGVHTVLIRYKDTARANEFIKINLTVDEPIFTTNGLQVTISNIPNVKVIRTAYGEYYTPGDTKRAEGARNFSNKSVIKNAEDYTIQYREEGIVTIIVEYNNGYVKVFHYDVQKKSPTVEQNGNMVSLGNLDGLYVVRYAEGEYTTPKQIKNAPGNKVIKTEDVLDGYVTVTLNPGIYTFYVQYDDESYNYYNIVVE